MAIRTVHTSTFIESDPMHVWDVLTDFKHLQDWNPLITAAEGDLLPKRTLKLTVQPRKGSKFKLNVEVLEASPGNELRWAGHLMIGGLLDAEHYFRISASTTGVRFVQGCVFSGVFTAFLPRSILSKARRQFDDMNRALKFRIEREV